MNKKYCACGEEIAEDEDMCLECWVDSDERIKAFEIVEQEEDDNR